MNKPTALSPISTPLNSTVLIEASAGTGKTYTMASLYLRLLLQAGENCFVQPLTVDRILVVTFTEAATQELKERIRRRVHLARQQLLAYRANPDKTVFIGTENAILAELVDSVTDLDLAVQRLHLAEQNMDLAAIYTIHGFCHRLLHQYAFNSGIHFTLELIKDETPLLEKLVQDSWRRHFYQLPFLTANFIRRHLGSPQKVLNKIRQHVSGERLKLAINRPHLLELPFADFMAQYVEPGQRRLAEFKRSWLEHEAELMRLISDARAGKRLKGASFQEKHVAKRFADIRAWAENPTDIDLPEPLTKYFRQSGLNGYLTDVNRPVEHDIFARADRIAAQAADDELLAKITLYHYMRWVTDDLLAYKLNHPQKGFNDLLRLVKEALYAGQGDELANLIRHQYPFAMIDEFQDTDAQQYRIFHKIYMNEKPQNTGFIMIGDPKQAIYKFRGADIFTYLKAAGQAEERFTLGTNYRSERHLVETVNRIFDFTGRPPFLYEEIQFQPVKARQDQARFVLDGEIQPPLACYLGDYSKQQLAEICAASVQQWLTQANRGDACFRPSEPAVAAETLQAKHIAVLVRNRHEAGLVKKALLERGIASVYLSDRSNLFDCPEAEELALILAACLNPFSERNILNAVSTTMFALTSAEILRIRQDEILLENWVDRFENYQRTWRRQGVLPMIYQLLLERSDAQPTIPEKLLALPDGERRLTDVLHLAEVLQQAAALNESEAALLRWFERRIRGLERNDEQQTRLESERELVKIVTVHKSKGLEYDLVWLPFIGQNIRENKQEQEIATYYDAQTRSVCWDLERTHSALVRREQLAEEMRLLYVALTRAKYQVAMALPAEFRGDQVKAGKNDGWSAILYALTQGEIGEAPLLTQSYPTEELLCKRFGKENIRIYPVQEIGTDIFTPLRDDVTRFAAEFDGKIETDWTLSSFTALSAMHERNRAYKTALSAQSAVGFSSVFDQAADYDHQAMIENIEPASPNDWPQFPLNRSPADFPGGISVGLELHGLLEKTDFNRGVQGENIEKLCRNLRLDDSWISPAAQWLRQILDTPLSADRRFTLSAVPASHCVKEMQFYLKLSENFSVSRFNRILRKYRFTAEPFLLDEIRGMIRGFIDLVFLHDGKYYLLDYKSNLLGGHLRDYAASALPQVMEAERYHLQYLLYTLALHRYLPLRDAQYRYDEHFGGVIYAFLRGMNGENADSGVFFTRPDDGLIRELEPLFYA